MELDNSFTLTNDIFNKKRKRIFQQKSVNLLEAELSEDSENNEFLETQEDEDLDKDFEVLEETNKDGNIIRKIQNKNTHKIIITEERMSDALRDLQIEMETETRQSPTKNSNCSFKISNELKSSIQNIEREENNLTKKIQSYHMKHTFKDCDTLEMQKMQIIPWVPNKIEVNLVPNDANKEDDAKSKTTSQMNKDSESDKLLNYKVEEPCDKKNFLKRKYSLINTMLIEEIKSNDITTPANSSSYIVELSPDEDLLNVQDSRSSTNKSSVNIIEIPEDHDKRESKQATAEEEDMEL